MKSDVRPYFTFCNLDFSLLHFLSYPSFQNRSLRYLSPESQRMVTITGSWFLLLRQVAGDFQAAYDGGGGGDSYQQSGCARQLARHGVGVFGGDFEILIGECARS